MRRVVWIWVTGALLLVLGAAGAAGEAVAAPARRHAADQRLNIVVILSDDERSDGTAVMKNLRTLIADHGFTFTDAHVTTSLCGPSRASILTGQYSHHTGVLDNFGPHSYPAFKNESNDLAVWMHRAGYETALVGKYINSYTDAYVDHAVPPGWDDWQAMDSIPMEAYYNYSINDNGHLVHYGKKPSDYSTTVLAHKAVQFIQQARHPFFLYFAPVAPHLPAIPAKRDQGKLENIAPIHSPDFNQRNIGKEPWRFWHKDMLSAAAQLYINHVRIHQEESLLALDRSVRSVVQALKARHELNRTVILYTSDNGFLWGEHRLGGKVWPYQESTHVPLIVRTPWATSAERNNQPVLNIDFAPTISALAGIKPGLPEDGRSLVPFLHGEQEPWRHAFLVEYLGRNLLHVHGGPPPYLAVQTRRNLYVEYKNGWRELYNLKKDPWELNNIAGDPRTKPLQARLNQLLQRLYDAPPTPG